MPIEPNVILKEGSTPRNEFTSDAPNVTSRRLQPGRQISVQETKPEQALLVRHGDQLCPASKRTWRGIPDTSGLNLLLILKTPPLRRTIQCRCQLTTALETGRLASSRLHMDLLPCMARLRTVARSAKFRDMTFTQTVMLNRFPHWKVLGHHIIKTSRLLPRHLRSLSTPLRRPPVRRQQVVLLRTGTGARKRLLSR
jgi:hypothetical protein